MRKLLLVGLVLCFLLGNLAFGESVEYKSKNEIFVDELLKNGTNIAMDCIAYMDSQNMGKNFIENSYFRGNMAEYLNKKAEISKRYLINTGSIKEHYQINGELINFEFLDNSHLLKATYKITTSFRYTDLPKDNRTSVSYGIFILFDSYTGHAIDMKLEIDYLDDIYRGQDYSLEKYNKASNEMLNDLQKIDVLKEVQLLIDGFKTRDTSVTLPNLQNHKINSIVNRNGLVNYVRNNYYKNQPSSGNGFTPYYDFSQISGNYDCTNFISHSMLAASVPSLNNGNPSTGWYYNNLSSRSYSWSGVAEFHNHMITRSNVVPAGRSFVYSPNHIGVNNWKIGDVMQFHNGTIWRHSTAITGTYNYQTGIDSIGALVTGRTSSLSYNNNQKEHEIYANRSRRVIRFD